MSYGCIWMPCLRLHVKSPALLSASISVLALSSVPQSRQLSNHLHHHHHHHHNQQQKHRCHNHHHHLHLHHHDHHHHHRHFFSSSFTLSCLHISLCFPPTVNQSLEFHFSSLCSPPSPLCRPLLFSVLLAWSCPPLDESLFFSSPGITFFPFFVMLSCSSAHTILLCLTVWLDSDLICMLFTVWVWQGLRSDSGWHGRGKDLAPIDGRHFWILLLGCWGEAAKKEKIWNISGKTVRARHLSRLSI